MSEEKNKPSNPLPTNGEMEALKVLWKHGPSTVRFVHELITKGSKTVRYTSTLKMMQLMTEKRMVKRDESKMTHIYYALLEEKPTMGTIAERFIQSMYNGSISSLFVALMDNKKTSIKEIEQIRALLEQLDDEENPALT